MMSLSGDKQADVINAFNTTSRYLDDIFNMMINVTTLILKLSISYFKMVMFLALQPMESISLNSFV